MAERTEAGSISLALGLDTAPLRRNLKSATSSASRMLESSFSGIGKRSAQQFASPFKGIGRKIAGLVGTAAIVSFTKSCIELGSNLTEVQNVVDTSFKTMNESVNTFAKSAMTEFGLSETVAKKYMGTIGAMNNAFGFTEKASLDMAKSVTGLAGDVASFYNMGSDEAFTKLKSIWTGETETLKDLGVVMTQTALDEYALNNGLGKATAKMTEQEKVMLRFQYVTNALSDATGDFAKTQYTWANQTRILTLRFESFKATLGQGFINLFTPILRYINKMMADLTSLAESFKSFTEIVTGEKQETAKNLGAIADQSNSVASGMDNVTSSVKEASRQLAGFDKITKLSDKESGTDSTANSIDNITNSMMAAVDNSVYEQKANTAAEKIIQAFKNHDYKSVGAYINDAISGAMESIKWNKAYSAASGFAKGLAQFLNGLISPRLFYDTGKTVAGALNTALMAAFSFADNFDFSNFGESIAAGINGFFKNYKFKKLAMTINKWVDGIEDMIVSCFKNISWKTILKKTGDFLGALDLDTVAIILGALTWKFRSAAVLTTASAALSSKLGTSLPGISLALTVLGISWKFAKDASDSLYDNNSFDEVKDASEKYFTDKFGKNPFSLTLSDAYVTASSFIYDRKQFKDALELMGKDIAEGNFKLNFGEWFELPSMNELGFPSINDLVSEIEWVFDDSDNSKADWVKKIENERLHKEIMFDIIFGKNTMSDEVKKKWKSVAKYWIDKSGIFSIVSKNTPNGIKVLWNKLSAAWREKHSKFGILTEKTKSVKASWDNLKNIWRDKKAKFGVSQGTSKKEVNKSYSTLSNVWSNKTATFGVAIGNTNKLYDTAESIKSKLESIFSKIGIGFDFNELIISKDGKNAVKTKQIGITAHAEGGFPQSGQLFIARENGLNEMVGKIGNSNAVANNGQIISGIEGGSYRGMMRAISKVNNIASPPQLAYISKQIPTSGEIKDAIVDAIRIVNASDSSSSAVELLKQILDVLKTLDLDIVIDGKKLKDIIVSRINSDTRRTGVCEIVT